MTAEILFLEVTQLREENQRLRRKIGGLLELIQEMVPFLEHVKGYAMNPVIISNRANNVIIKAREVVLLGIN